MRIFLDNIKQAFGRGRFPSQMSVFLDLGIRRLIKSPEIIAKQLHLTVDQREITVLLQDPEARRLAEELSMRIIQDREQAETEGKLS